MSEAFYLTLVKERLWNREKGDLVHHLFRTIDSLVYNKINSAEYQAKLEAIRLEVSVRRKRQAQCAEAATPEFAGVLFLACVLIVTHKLRDSAVAPGRRSPGL